MKRFRFLAAAALLLCGASLSAQSDYASLIREDPDRAAGVHHSYEYRPGPGTAVPDGYTPFYVSHYGRHGSRRATSGSARKAYEYMDSARVAGILTPEGEELYKAVAAIYSDHVDMVGELTPRGGREHRAIAQRLHDRVQPVWHDPARRQVFVQSSNIPRCLLSMAHFTASLDDNAPELVFDFVTGDRYLDLLAHDYYNNDEISEASNELMAEMASERVDPSRLMKTVFIADSARVAAVIPSPLDFTYRIFSYGGIRQCTETPDADIFGRFFTLDELIAWYPCYNAYIYSAMANSAEFGDHVIWAARGLLRDIIDRADAALRDDSPTAADLRFGHDSGILPLAGLMDLVGPGDRLHNADASDSWQSFFQVPMATNLQMVFYRKPGAEPLVKLWYNERETQVRGLSPVSGNCYRWSDLRAHFERRIAAAAL
ncbi:MAG: histidine-type phosphatase [Bacteroidales bacterium]|nr:histidine-type phosphatase [Bacteroidales bacterium]